MSQLALFDPCADHPRGWHLVAASAGGKGNTYRHGETGWVIEHCGHPTALWPYSIYNAAGERVTMGVGGPGCFADLATCKAVHTEATGRQ